MAVDGNWLVHRAYHQAARNSLERASMLRVVSAQVITQVFRYALRLSATNIVLAFDGPDNFRKEVYPLYKANRLNLPELSDIKLLTLDKAKELMRLRLHLAKDYTADDPVNECRIATQALADRVGLFVFQPKRHEADDALCSAGSLVLKGAFVKVTNVTNDKDMINGLAPGVQLYRPEMQKQPEVFTRYNDMKAHLVRVAGAKAAKWSPEQFLDYQTMIGDPVDFIPRVLPPGKAVSIINEHGSLLAFSKTEEGIGFFRSNREWIHRNRLLVTMDTTLFDDCRDIRKLSVPAVNKLNASGVPTSVAKAMSDYLSLRPSFNRPKLF